MVAQSLRSFVAERLKNIVRCYRRSGEAVVSYLRESTSYFDIGEPGLVITELFRKVQDIPGWFNVDDCGHFCLVLSFQFVMGVKGDLLEIGSYHG
jgi:hypothetical protein